MIRKKILLLGDFSVGKTSLIRRYVEGSFSDSYLSTIGVKISKKSMMIGTQSSQLIIWDIEGSTPLKSIPQSYYNGASGAIIVVDVSRKETIGDLQKHINTFLQRNPKGKYRIAYNKVDLLTKAQQEECLLDERSLFTSAKSDENVQKLFSDLVKEIF
jgi:small GTP-binding protein